MNKNCGQRQYQLCHRKTHHHLERHHHDLLGHRSHHVHLLVHHGHHHRIHHGHRLDLRRSLHGHLHRIHLVLHLEHHRVRLVHLEVSLDENVVCQTYRKPFLVVNKGFKGYRVTRVSMMSSLKMSKVVGIGGDRENSVELEKINKINVNYIHGPGSSYTSAHPPSPSRHLDPHLTQPPTRSFAHPLTHSTRIGSRQKRDTLALTALLGRRTDRYYSLELRGQLLAFSRSDDSSGSDNSIRLDVISALDLSPLIEYHRLAVGPHISCKPKDQSSREPNSCKAHAPR